MTIKIATICAAGLLAAGMIANADSPYEEPSTTTTRQTVSVSRTVVAAPEAVRTRYAIEPSYFATQHFYVNGEAVHYRYRPFHVRRGWYGVVLPSRRAMQIPYAREVAAYGRPRMRVVTQTIEAPVITRVSEPVTRIGGPEEPLPVIAEHLTGLK